MNSDGWDFEEIEDENRDWYDISCENLTCGICWECEEDKEEYFNENFPDAWKEDCESGLDEDDINCLKEDCEGWIDECSDVWEENIVHCSTCGTEYVYCDTCRGWYILTSHYLCPNDH